MNNLIKITTDLREKRALTLVLTANKAREGITELIANLILHSPLFVVAGGEWLPAYELTRKLRRKTLEVKQCLNRLHITRTSTCYRLLDSLTNIPSNGEPILVLDFLYTFYDSDIPLNIRFRKLRECCRQLERLAFYRPLLVITQELPTEDYGKFLPILQAGVDRTITLEPEPELVSQPALF